MGRTIGTPTSAKVTFDHPIFINIRLILILYASFFVCPALGQEIEYPYKHDLKGSVQECSEKKFAARFVVDKIEPGEYMEDAKIGIRLFDRDGRLLEFRAQADTSGKYERIVLTYLESGCLREMIGYRASGGIDGSSIYECDRKGNVIEKTDYYFLYEGKATGRTTYKYDKANRITETHKKYGTPNRNTKKSGTEFEEDRYEHRYYEYDKNGFLVKWSIKREGIDPDFVDLLSGGADITNDEVGRPLAEYSLNDLAAKEGKVKKLSKEMEYNEEGFLSKMVQYYNLTGPAVTYYEYTYDDHGNWITKTEIKSSDKSGKVPDSITVREIRYY